MQLAASERKVPEPVVWLMEFTTRYRLSARSISVMLPEYANRLVSKPASFDSETISPGDLVSLFVQKLNSVSICCRPGTG